MLNDNIVTKKDERPAGEPGKCFYCGANTGDPHRVDCVAFRRTVVVKATISLLVEVPAVWSPQEIEFYYNESSHCSDDIVDKIIELADRRNDEYSCMCPFIRVKYDREADKGDHEIHMANPEG